MVKAKKMSIIHKIKTLVRKTGHTIFRSAAENNISEDVAKKIQKAAYEISHQHQKSAHTPPYLSVIEQLQVQDDQIFRAAVFSLANIAINEKKDAGNILLAMQKYIESNKRTKEQTDYINSKIEQIKKI